MASLVVPSILETITRCSPKIVFTSEDLPTFGRPITLKRIEPSSCWLALSPNSPTIASSKSPIPVP